MRLVVGVSSLGKSPRVWDQLETLAAQTDRDFTFILCDQSNGALSLFRERLVKSGVRFQITNKPVQGASAGRNEIISEAPLDTTHFYFPNDTTTFDLTFIADVKSRLADKCDLLVMGYKDQLGLRYKFNEGFYRLDKRNAWLVIEPAMVISKRVIDFSKGFDVNLGSGAKGPYRSGEGTDLLLRAMEIIDHVRWEPSLTVNGVLQNYNLSPKQSREKLYFYGRGYGYLLRKYNYDPMWKIRAILGPFQHITLRKFFPSVMDALYSSCGRARSIFFG